MGKFHGRRGRLYVAVAAGDAPSPLTYQNKWTASFATDTVEGTDFESTNKEWFAGLPDAQGTFSGFLDDVTTQTYSAARDGLARAFYLYPSALSTGKYIFGTAIFDFAAAGGTSEMATMSGTWKGSGPINRVQA